jgi:hypothetical protein
MAVLFEIKDAERAKDFGEGQMGQELEPLKYALGEWCGNNKIK